MANTSGGLILISPLVQEALSKATSFAAPLPGSKVTLAPSLKKKFKNLVDSLIVFGDVVEGAELTQESDPAIRLWLQKLSDVVYDAVDVLDELDYITLEMVQNRVEEQQQRRPPLLMPQSSRWADRWADDEIPSHKQQKLAAQATSSNADLMKKTEILWLHEGGVHVWNNSVSPSKVSAYSDKEITDKLTKISVSLSEVRKKVDFIKLMIPFRKKNLATAMPNYGNFHLFRNSKLVAERENDVTEIVKLLATLRNGHPISGISIVGMAGMGKTTVAGLVYGKAKEEKLYDVVAWVSVSGDFNDKRILSGMLEFCDDFGDVHMNEETTVDELLQHLREKLKKKTFLLILDDLWDKDARKWNALASNLSKIVDLTDGRTCSIVLTTQSKHVASVTMMENLFPMLQHDARFLSDDECWLIIQKTVLRSSFETSIPSDLEDVGKEIAKRCGGLPLAAVIIGETLSRQMEIDEWMTIRDNNSWLLSSEDGNKILSAFRSSFDRLSAPLKKCFSYCSIFRRGYAIEKDEIVQIWKAQGLLHQPDRSRMTPEDVGNQYLSYLLSNSFFQNEVRDGCGNILSCKMHDIMHELALFLSEGDTSIWGPRCSLNIRHLRFEHCENWDHTANIPRDVVQRALSLFCEKSYIPYLVESELKSLRCLQVKEYEGRFRHVNLVNLKSLKYLDISRSSFEMPVSFSKLRNLETLKLTECPTLTSLEIGMNIRSLKISHCSSLTSIQSIGDLTFLQSFEVNNCCKLRSLPTKLASCKSLKNLRLTKIGYASVPRLDWLSSLESLELNRDFIKVSALPDSVNSLSLRISDCHDSSIHVEGFSSLESLELSSCYNLTILSGLSSCRSLKRLIVTRCKKITSIPQGIGDLRFLQYLDISYCDKLDSIPQTCFSSSLTDLKMGPFSLGLKKFPGLKSIHHLHASLKVLTITGWHKLKSLPPQLAQFTALEELVIREFNRVKKLPEWLGHLSSLRRLEIEGCASLSQFPSVEAMRSLSNLQSLKILACPEIYLKYTQGSGTEWSKVSHIPQVRVSQ